MNYIQIQIRHILPMILLCATACTDDYYYIADEDKNIVQSNDGDAPEFASMIPSWNGETADDASQDIVGSGNAFYHENNNFPNTVTITYNNDEATIESNNPGISCVKSGNHVTIDMQSNGIGNTEIKLKGKSDNGSLKLYGKNKIKLTLQGVELSSANGPAINNQCKKTLYIHAEEGTTNRFCDTPIYGNDTYYLNDPTEEDRKGCLFSEGSMIFSGKGIVVIAAKYRHGIASDSYIYTRPGITLAITEAAKNAIHAKGDVDDGIGVHIQGGLIYANISSPAGKGIKTDLNINLCGGKVLLNTDGDGEFDPETSDTSSPAAIKADGDIIITGGEHLLRSSGNGGKGINATGNLIINGGTTTAITTGNQYIYSERLTSSPKSVKADGSISVSGGILNIAATGNCDGSEGFESKNDLNISGGEIYIYSYDDAVNVTRNINFTEGKLYAYSCNNDGIDANGKITVSGGLFIGIGAGSPESGIDVDTSDQLLINGGNVIAMGGNQIAPSQASRQRSLLQNNIQVAAKRNFAVLNASNTPVVTFTAPRSMERASLLISSPEFSEGSTYTLSTEGNLIDSSASWNGWHKGGSWSEGNNVATLQ